MALLQLLSLLFLTVTQTTERQEAEDKKKKKQAAEAPPKFGRKYDIGIYKRGDLLVVPRTLFTHFGIYLGDDRVAHLIPDVLLLLTSNKKTLSSMVTNLRLILGAITKASSIRVDNVEDFAYGAQILVNPMDNKSNCTPLDGEEVATRAEKLLGPVNYSLLWYNCEHYVMYCRYGSLISFQTSEFCNAVRLIILSKMSSFVTALIGVAIMFYYETHQVYSLLATFIVSFLIWMAA